MQTIISFFKDMIAMLPTLKFMDIIDILVVAFVIYKIIVMVRSTSAARVLKGIAVLIVLAILTKMLNMYLLNYILDKVLEIGILALIIMFQPELRRILEKLGSRSFPEVLQLNKKEQSDMARVIAETVKACDILSKERTGVLIVFERETSLSDYEKTGTKVDALITSELLRNIFFVKASLHDGAVIVRNARLSSAGCVLPLTEDRTVSSDLGTRHRAGIGMSEASDAVVVIVSEETGTISVAINGMLKRHLAAKTLEKLLVQELLPVEEESTKNPIKIIKGKVEKSLKKDDTDAET